MWEFLCKEHKRFWQGCLKLVDLKGGGQFREELFFETYILWHWWGWSWWWSCFFLCRSPEFLSFPTKLKLKSHFLETWNSSIYAHRILVIVLPWVLSNQSGIKLVIYANSKLISKFLFKTYLIIFIVIIFFSLLVFNNFIPLHVTTTKPYRRQHNQMPPGKASVDCCNNSLISLMCYQNQYEPVLCSCLPYFGALQTLQVILLAQLTLAQLYNKNELLYVHVSALQQKRVIYTNINCAIKDLLCVSIL